MAPNVHEADARAAQPQRECPQAGVRGKLLPASERSIQRVMRRQFRKLSRRMEQCADDVERVKAVHRLRTATRRVDAALRLFGPLLPDRRRRRLRRKVRKIRRAAGLARDLDVLIARLAQAPHIGVAPLPQDPLPLLAELRQRRSEAADQLLDVVGSSDSNSLMKRGRRLARRARVRDGDASESIGSPVVLLQPLLLEFRSAAAADLSTAAGLHEFRKAGKRLRYAIELLTRVDPAAVSSQFAAALRDLQARLGVINDHAAAVAVLTDVAGTASDRNAADAAVAAVAAEQAEFEDSRRQFLAWWDATGRSQLDAVL